jgi:RNA polymerase sigma factor (sigma-70 family)
VSPRARPRRKPRAVPPFERLVELHGPSLLRFCAARAGPERAEDCFQETMLAALRSYPELRDPRAARSWLFSIAARKAIDAHRARARAPQLVADLGPLAAADPAPIRDRALWSRVQQLPDKQRDALLLRYLADLSHREIAEVLQIREDAARRNVFEALRRLRRELKK